jgi:bifunctional non-homologous end joining protein LigD
MALRSRLDVVSAQDTVCAKRDLCSGRLQRKQQGRLDSLYIARGEDGDLVYAGSVERGFSAGDVRELEARLRPLITRQSPLADAVRKPKARWVRPEVLVEVAYPNASADGRLRHPSFKGFRDDIELE